MSILSSAELVAMGRHIPTPFSISIATEQGELELTIESLLRVVPGKRFVALSSWHNRTVIIKMFIHENRWKRSMLRDISGINRLRQAKIPTPNLLLQSTTADGKAGVLIIEYLQQGVSLATLFDAAKNDENKTEVIELGVKAVALCHEAGLWQKDIHLDNFMLSSGTVYVLDGADIKSLNGSVDSATRLKNFALFIAQFPVALDAKWGEIVEKYLQQATGVSEEKTSGFGALVKKARRKRLDAYERKLRRSTTAHRCEQSSSFFYAYDRAIHSAELDRFIANPDSFIAGRKLLKDGNSSTVAVIKIDKKNYVVKRYNIKGFWHGVSRAFRPSRAYNSWRNALLLEMLGIATAHPYLFLEQRRLWLFRGRAYYLCEYIPADDLTTAWGKE